MSDISTTYLGLNLKNPVLVGSCGFTSSVDKIKKLADNNAAAVILKSLFEEQIQAKLSRNLESYNTDYPGAADYVREYTRGSELKEYLSLISGAKKAVDIPVIASVHCVSGEEWGAFAKAVQEEGADALELNISVLPSNPRISSEDNEKRYFDILNRVGEKISIPITLKMSHYSASLANLISRLSWNDNLAGFVLFSRYYTPDIDIDKLIVKSSSIFSTPAEINGPLRWIALMSGVIDKDLSASTGVHDGEGLIKQILAGATVVQVVSTIYKNGPEQIGAIIEGLEKWMVDKSFDSLQEFRGKLSYEQAENADVFERTQFMKYYGGMS